MGYEIDFLPVGEGERPGEAIALRYGNLFGARNEQDVIVIDGGNKESGEQLVNHIKHFYNTDSVDVVVSTHADADHSSGLSVVLEKLTVGQLWMHQPWKHSDEYRDLFKDGRLTENGLEKTLQESLQNAYGLEEIAREKGVPVIEPFSDIERIHNAIIILSPSQSFYETQLANFRGTPEPKEAISLLRMAGTRVVETGKMIAESLGLETLKDPDENETSAENNSSVVMLLNYNNGEELFLFTGDAGPVALREAIKTAEGFFSVDFNLVRFIQIPHHGSKHNIGPTILDNIIGLTLGEEKKLKTAFVSVARDDKKHPSKKVANAFRRRGAWVYETRGSKILHHKNAPPRGWREIQPLPLYNEVEE
jgi:beta-lactamase superfamily II metal-dependent hydrolase